MARLRRLVGGAGFRFAMMSTLAFMVCVAAIGATARFAVVAELEAQAVRNVEAEASALMDEFVHGGRPDLDAALTGRARGGGSVYRYAVTGGSGGLASGPGSFPDLAAPAGITASRALGDGTGIVVADDLARVRAVRDMVDHAFLIALGVAALLGICAAGLLSGTLLGRLDRVTRAADAVAAGSLSARMPLDGSGDEFDRLAATLNRMLDRIVGLLGNLRQVSNDVAHDLRTPLSRLRQGLEAARRRARTIEEYEGAVERAMDDVDGILDIFAALLRIAQVEGGSRRSGFGVVDLAALVSEVAEAYGAAAEDDGRGLVAEISAGLTLDGDRELLAQLLANLVENAMQHTPSGSRIRMGAAHRSPDTVAIWVADEGPGIPAAERDKVLRRFYRLDRSRSDERHGLGLSLVAAIVELHGGRLTLSDREPGLMVDVELPRRAVGDPS